MKGGVAATPSGRLLRVQRNKESTPVSLRSPICLLSGVVKLNNTDLYVGQRRYTWSSTCCLVSLTPPACRNGSPYARTLQRHNTRGGEGNETTKQRYPLEVHTRRHSPQLNRATSCAKLRQQVSHSLTQRARATNTAQGM